MNKASSTGSTPRTISGRGQLLLAGLLAVLFAATALTLTMAVFKPAATLAGAKNAAQVVTIQSQTIQNTPRLAQNSASVSGTPPMRAGDDTLSAEWLVQRNSAGAGHAAARPQDDTLSAEWLVQRNAASAGTLGDLQQPAGQNPVLLPQTSTPVTTYSGDSGPWIP